MKKWLLFLLVGLISIGISGIALASPILVTDRSTLAGTDFVEWGTLGIDGTIVANPSTIISSGGINIDLSKAVSGNFLIYQQAVSFMGSFAPGDFVLYTNNFFSTADNPILLNFGGTGVIAGGAQIEANILLSNFTAKIEIFDSLMNSLGSVTRDGYSSLDNYNDNSAIFLGISNDVPFYYLSISLDSHQYDFIGDFAINQFDFTPNPVPEPTTMLLLGTGLAGVAGAARRKKRI